MNFINVAGQMRASEEWRGNRSTTVYDTGLPQEKRALKKCGRVESTRSASDDEEGGW